MRRVQRSATPAALAPTGSKGADEYTRARAFFSTGPDDPGSFTFTAYKDPEVQAALRADFGTKCAYCESSYAEVMPSDIEHFRPKSGYLEDGKLRKPGYWWLAMRWENLLPSCIDCNRARRQELDDGDVQLAGKANEFPLAPGSPRASSPGQEAHEVPLLLDPTQDDPDAHLEFLDNGTIRPTAAGGTDDPRGTATIRVMALRRSGLVTARRGEAVLVATAIKHARRVMDDIGWTQAAPGLSAADRAERIAELRERLDEELEDIASKTRADHRYSALTTTMAERFRTGEVLPFLRALGWAARRTAP